MLVEVEAVTKRYGNGTLANDNISLEIAEAEVFGLLGPNGAGKTTLVRQIVALTRPTSGTIRLDGVDIVRSPAAARRLCSFQPQGEVPVEGMAPLEAVTLVGRLRGLSKREAARRASELVERLDLTSWASQRTGLSGGVHRLLGFCFAAVAPGRLVVLDEPTNDVDPRRRRLLWDEVQSMAAAGSAVVLVTHNVLEAERAVDRLAIVDSARLIAAGTPASLKKPAGAALRLELVLEPGAAAPLPPADLRVVRTTPSRMIVEVDPGAAAIAVEWAGSCQRSGSVEEFSLGPNTLEDVYLATTTQTEEPDVLPA